MNFIEMKKMNLKKEIEYILETYACDICSKFSGTPWIGNDIDKVELSRVLEMIMKVIKKHSLTEPLE